MILKAPIISIDIEDWQQSTWDRDLPITQRAKRNTVNLLERLDRLGIRTTMFILGKFAETFPEVVREIDNAGHEIGCHGHSHLEIFGQSRDEFTEDISRAKDFLEQTVGKPVNGYRAPDFSIIRESLWALEALAEAGFSYDSSIFPVRHPRYGIPDWPVRPVMVTLQNGMSIREFPIATFTWMGKNLPIGGGGYHRLLPGMIVRWIVRPLLVKRPFVLYVHPYEFDPDEFREIDLDIPLKTKLHQGLGRKRTGGRFDAFVREFGGQRFTDIIENVNWISYKVNQPGSVE